MNELFSHIAYLIRRHDCVILGGIGAFVAVREPAAFDMENHRVIPPRRSVAFNGAITHDDGLLSASISRRQGMSFEQAAATVSSAIADIRKRLDSDGAVYFPRIGTLHLGDENRVIFTPESPTSASVMLPSLQLRQHIPAPVISVEVEQQSASRSVAVVRVPLHRRMISSVASIAMLLILGFALSTPIDIGTAQTASLATPSFTAPQAVTIDPIPQPEGLELNLAIPNRPDAIIGMDIRPAINSVQTTADNGRYVMVVASLPCRSQAEAYITHDGNPSLRILEKGDKFRVYITSGTTQSEVSEQARAIADFESRYPGAWVCRR